MPDLSWYRVNLHLMQPQDSDRLADLIEEPDDEGKTVETQRLRIAGHSALLAYISVARERARWSQSLASLTGTSLPTHSTNPSAVLLLDVDSQVFALCYGMAGTHLLAQPSVAHGFGLRLALRVLEPESIRQLNRLSLDTRSRVDRSSVPSGQEVRGFGVEEIAEIVNRIGGKAAKLDISYTRERAMSFALEGADSVRIPLPVTGPELIADLRVILRLLDQPPAEELAFIEKVERLQRKDRRIPPLDKRLGELLADPGLGALGMGLPTEYLDENDEVHSYRIEKGRHRTIVEEVELDPILDVLGEGEPEQQRRKLKQMRIVGCADAGGTDQNGPRTPAELWIAAELTSGPNRYVLQQGHWYEVRGGDYIDFLRREVDQILAHQLTWVLPPWPADRSTGRKIREDDYNEKEVAAKDTRFLVLDKNLIRSPTHPTGFEACDLLGPDGELIHVKRAQSSAPLSHLFSQGVVSADTLCIDQVARAELRAKVEQVDPSRVHLVGDRPKAIVYAIHLARGNLTSASLFTFATIALVRAHRHIYSRLGIPVYAIAIP